MYVADYGNDLIRKVTAAGLVSTIAGKAGISGSTDGDAEGRLNLIAVNPAGGRRPAGVSVRCYGLAGQCPELRECPRQSRHRIAEHR